MNHITTRTVKATGPALRLLLLVTLAGPAWAGEVVEYVHLDAIGNVRVVTNQAQVVVERHDYMPFGEECSTGPCASNPGLNSGQPRKFTAKERDPETGFDYFGARYYSSHVGRFTTTDPYLDQQAALFNPQRWNRYAYGLNNPLRFVDPDGRDVFDKMAGAYNAFVSDYFMLPVIRGDSLNPDFVAGQVFGDRAALTMGAVQTYVGLTGEGAGIVASGTGVGAIAGVPAIAVSAGIAAHGAAVTTIAAIHLSKNSGDLGSIYQVPGSATGSGKPYIGRHNKPNPAKTRRSRDGRDRTQAEVIDNYDPGNVQQGRVKEQAEIDKRGLGNLDNKRNEIRKD